MKNLTIFIFILCIFSCEYFNKQRLNSHDIVTEEFKTFNWNDIDTYPSFTICDSLNSRKDLEQCFENTLITHISKRLSESLIIVTETVDDTLMINIHISKTGKPRLNGIKQKDITKFQIPELDSLVSNSLLLLPKIFPAIKRGQQVNTEFVLPMLIQVN